MAVELQIESRTLSDITTRALQSQLNSTCFPAFGDAYVDHANVVFGPLAQTAKAGAVQLHAPVDLFMVLRTAVLAAPNSLPAGATVIADQNGRAMVPVLLPLASSGASAQLTRSSRRPIAGRVEVQSAILEARASLATAGGQTFSSGAGTLGLTLLDNRSLHRDVSADAIHSPATTEKAPPCEPDPCEGLRGVTTVLRVPGFEDAPIAVALMKDGAALVMDLANRRCPRVAGTFNGPVGAIQTAGNWALASADGVTSIYRVSHSPDDGRSRVECSCISH